MSSKSTSLITLEKITLKPTAKEIIHKSSEPDVFFDAFSYNGNTVQEKNLGSLYVLGQLKQKQDDLGYLVSLFSSLAKREYYSPEAIQEQNPKAAFEQTLKKLNEILGDFFAKKDFNLNLGLAVIAGENVYISKLGKFKVALARDNEYIDILNNIELFKKEEGHEKQFSNIISGKIKANDKIFAYFPIRAISSREKLLNPIFVSQSQPEFSQKIAQLAANASNFACCGIHISISEVKEIPINMASMTEAPVTSKQTAETAVKSLENNDNQAFQLEPKALPELPAKSMVLTQTASSALSREVSVAKQDYFFTPIIKYFHKLGNFLPNFRTSVIAFLLLAITFSGWWLIGRGDSSQARTAYNQAQEILKLARAKLAQNDSKEGRILLQSALAAISGLENKNILAVRNEISTMLNTINHVSDKQPVVALEADTGKLFASIVPAALQESVGTKSVTLYEDNLYVLDGNTIFKYPDAVKGGTKSTVWGTLESPAIAIAADGNIYTLTPDGKAVKYFKGKKEGEIDLQVKPTSQANIITFKDSPFIYLSNLTNRQVYVFDKTSGVLKVTYKLDAAGAIQKISIDASGVIWLLAADNKVWQITP